MAKTFHCTIEVRGYELDGFGHVNHAEYIHYCEHARWKMLAEIGLNFKEFSKFKRWPVIAALECKYLKPTFQGDRLEVQTKVVEHGRANFVFDQHIYSRGLLVFKARVKGVTVDERGKPAPHPPEVERLWNEDDLGGGI